MTMTANGMRKLLNRNAVLLALYTLSDRQGLLCHAANRFIAKTARRSLAAVREGLRELEAMGSISTFDRRDGLSHRIFVLRDHPDAKCFVRHIAQAYRGCSTKGA